MNEPRLRSRNYSAPTPQSRWADWSPRTGREQTERHLPLGRRVCHLVVEEEMRIDLCEDPVLVRVVQEKSPVDTEPQALRVVTTRLWAGAFRVVTMAI